MKITVNTKYMKIFESLSSSTRIQILELLGDGRKNIGELARQLNISSAITTRHINMLEEAGLVCTENMPGKRGLQKLCSLAANELVISFKKAGEARKYSSVSIPIGQYTAYEVYPTCGLASVDKFIGICDDPRYFSDPERVSAALLWFQSGWVEYGIPSYLFSSYPVHALEIVLELCSEYPNYNDNWPSDIHFYLNDKLLGIWTSPGDFGSSKGTYTPKWWKSGTQHGLLKTLRITSSETLLDGIHLSDVTINDIPLHYGRDVSFKIAVPSDCRNPGGVNIFGKGFGNYNQDIEVRVEYGT